MNTLQAQTAYIGSTEIKQVRLGNELVLAPNGDALWYEANELPSLDLRFAENKSLVDATTGANLVTFTRASSGTYVDSEGVIRTATTNLITSSSDIAGFFTEQNSTATADAAAAPDGTVTADLLVPNTSLSTHTSFNTSISFSASTTYSYSIFVKPNGYSWLQLLFTSGFNNLTAWVNFDLTGAGSFGFTGGGEISKEIESHPGGWYRCTITATSGASPFAGGPAYLVLDSNRNGRDANYAGDNTSGIYLWGAQLEQSSTVGEYIPTTSTINSAPRFDHRVTSSVTNLLLRSEEFDNASWTVTNGSVTADDSSAPNGATSADLLTATATGSYQGRLVQSMSSITAQSYTLSCYAKANNSHFLALRFVDAGSGNSSGYFNLLTGQVSYTDTAWTTLSISATDVGDGWYRCVISFSASSTDGSAETWVYPANGLSDNNVTTGNSIYLWGAQLEQSSTVGEYVPTTTAAVTVNTTESLGLLVEEQRANLLLQSEDFSTTWTTTNTTVSTNQVTAPDGATTADKIIETATTAEHNIRQDTASQVAGTYSASIFAKAGERDVIQFVSTGVLGGFRANFNLTNGVIGSVDSALNARITPFPNGWYRCSITATSTITGTLRAQWNIVTSPTAARVESYLGDVTKGLYLWGCAFEAGSFPTSYIPTTGATATRAADVARISGSNFSSWYRQDEGTVFAEFNGTNITSGQFPRILEFNDGTSNNSIRVQQYNAGANAVRASVVTAAVTQFAADNGSVAVGVRGKTAFGSALNDAALVTDGASPTTDATYLVPSGLTQLGIGGPPTSPTSVLNSTIRRLTYWPARLPNETLQTITQ
jgi:hypothetical protein